MSRTIEIGGYAVVLYGHDPVYGVGATREEALREALEWLTEEWREAVVRALATTDRHDSEAILDDGGVDCSPATRALVEEVERDGGLLSWERVTIDGRDCIALTAEAEALDGV